MKNFQTQTDKKPWHKEGLVWLVIGIPMTSVVLGIILLTLAINTEDSKVDDDYSEKGKQIILNVARNQYAVALKLTGTLKLDSENKVILQLHTNAKIKPESITLKILHPTRKKLDHILILKPDNLEADSRRYTASLPKLRSGKWYIHAETRRWRIGAVTELPSDTVSLRPSK